MRKLKCHRNNVYVRERGEEGARKKKVRKHKACRAPTVGAGMTARKEISLEWGF